MTDTSVTDATVVTYTTEGNDKENVIKLYDKERKSTLQLINVCFTKLTSATP